MNEGRVAPSPKRMQAPPTMRVPLLDLQAQYASIRDELEPIVLDVFQEQAFVLGPRVAACEKAIADYSNCSYGCGVSSGTDALVVALMEAEIRPNDEVITTPYTFFATAGSIARLGAKPIFADIDPVTYNVDPDQVADLVTPQTRAILPVHLYGQMAELDPLLDVAKGNDLVVIEDAAQAIGAEDKGRRAGSMGDHGCFSFFPSKNLGGAGDGGMVVTNDPDRAARLKQLRNHGMKPKYYNSMIGGNFRLDALQAAVVMVKLQHLDKWTNGRQKNALRYDQLMAEAGLAGDPVRLPHHTVTKPGTKSHIFNQYVIRVPRRDDLKTHLQEHEIATEIYYPIPLHLQTCFSYLGYEQGALPESEKAATETLALPIYPELTDDQATFVVETIRTFYT